MNQTHRPDPAPRHPAEMDFETIKTRARRIFATAIEAEAAYRGIHRGSNSPSYRTLLPFIRMVAAERDGLCEFVPSLPVPAREDWLAQKARWQAEHNRYHWTQMPLQVRVAGLRRIDDWDIRCLGSLIELFPGCVPKSWRCASLHGYLAEPSGEWRVRAEAAAPSFTRAAGLPRS